MVLLDRRVLGMVRSSLARNTAIKITSEKTTYCLFKALANMYEKPSFMNKVLSMHKLFNLKMAKSVVWSITSTISM